MGEILLAGEETQERAPLLGDVVADRAAQHRVPGLQCVKNRALCDWTFDGKRHLGIDVRQGSQVVWE